MPNVKTHHRSYCASSLHHVRIPCRWLGRISFAPLRLIVTGGEKRYACHPGTQMLSILSIDRRSWVNRNAHWNKSTLRCDSAYISSNESIAYTGEGETLMDTSHYNDVRSVLEIVESSKLVEVLADESHVSTRNQTQMSKRGNGETKKQDKSTHLNNSITRAPF